jgi:xanthosine utilization system XapX-like protein
MAFQQFLSNIGASIVDPFVSIWLWLVKAVPDIVAAIVILIVGYLVALAVSAIVQNVLNRVKFNEWVFDKTNMSHAVGKFDLAHFLAVVTKWYIIVLFLSATAARIQLETLSAFLASLSLWIPQVIVAVVIGLIGIMAGMYVEKKVSETRAKGSKIVAAIAKWAIYVFTALIVLDQAGVQVALAQNSFMIILGGIVLMIALLIGISFGMAFRDDAKKIISDVKKKL